MRSLVLLFIFILLSTNFYSQVTINQQKHHYRITEEVDYYANDHNNLNPNDILQDEVSKIKDLNFVNGSIKFKTPNIEYWGKIEVINNGNEDLVEIIYFNRNFLDSAYCYISRGDSLVMLGNSGDRIFLDEQQLSIRQNAFYFSIAAHDTVQLIFSMLENRSLVTDVYLTDLNSFVTKGDKEHLFIGSYFGVLIFLGIISILAFFFTRKRYFLYYSITVFAGLLSNSTSNGTWNSLFMGSFPDQAIWVHSFFVMLWILSFILFVGAFLRIEEHSKKLHKTITLLFKVFFILSTFLIVISTFFDFNILTLIMYFCILFVNVVLAFVIVKMIKYDRFNAKVLAWAFIPTFIFNIIYFLARSGKIQNDFLLNFSNQIGSLFMMITICVAIGLQIKKEFEQKIDLFKKLAIQENEFQKNLSFQREKQQHKIANLLHDSFGVKLKHIRSLIESNQLNFAQNEIGFLGTEIRDLSHSLSPTILDHLSLGEAIEDLSVKMSTSELRITVEGDLKHIVLSKSKKTNLYNIIQELINNTIKHAQANKLNIQLEVFEADYYITIEDDGVGFEIDEKYNSGLGIQSIKNRISQMHGVYEVSSSKTKGTMWVLKVPVQDRKEGLQSV